MIGMMHGEQGKSLADFGFLVCAQSILFGKFGSAFHWRFLVGGGAPWWLQHSALAHVPEFFVEHTHHSACMERHVTALQL